MIRCSLYIIYTLFGSLCLLVGGALVVAAAADDFTINLFVGIDTTSPTTPVLQSVIPVAATQIDILWMASTDDVVLSGYRVYRDGVPIATTTLTSFSDSGLSAATLYSYTVDAFDSFNNISSTSNALSTTTLALPVISPATTTATSTRGADNSTRLPGLQSFLLTPTKTRAAITWQTFGPTKYVFKWGRTTSYDSGTISGNLFLQQHVTFIDSLEPGTKYFFELEAMDPAGKVRVLKTDSFFTLAAVSSALPVNVESFNAVVRGTDVDLSWRTGTLPEGAVIRIVRSHLYFPSSITDGSLVYEGTGERITDTRAVSIRSPQYYTAFVVGGDGLVSSGAIAVAGRLFSPLPPTTEENPVIETGDVLILQAGSVMIIQGRERFTLDASKPLQADGDYLVYIPVSAVKPGLKSIIVSVQNPSNQRLVSRFLLKINQAGDAYEARIPAPLVTGASRLQIEVFDYTAASVRQITTTITFVRTQNPVVLFPDDLARTNVWWMVAGSVFSLFLALFLCWLWLRTSRREDNR